MKQATRPETKSIRFSQRNRYLVELAARAHRRSFSSFVECAATDCAAATTLPGGDSLSQHFDALWHVDPLERLRRLKSAFPALVTYDEDLELKAQSS
ncbi:hypothetical protein [Eoetvoesiella caeni]